MFGIKKKINILEHNKKEFKLFSKNPLYFFEECIEGFKIDKFNKTPLDECHNFKLNRMKNINDCIKLYLKHHSKVARLYGN